MKTMILYSIKAGTTKFHDNYLSLNADFCFFIIISYMVFSKFEIDASPYN